jgi:hypothetical protein
MAVCPYCRQQVTLQDVVREKKGRGIFKQETMYSCPHCQHILGFSRGNYS